eukprot:GEMP01031888.1.p1 GENE.GEMP01031888.1~~GEMP01031888.1.p1  ORF type:complete len:420 (+),score=124.51 GEMP01031888.1:97-1356(+)
MALSMDVLDDEATKKRFKWLCDISPELQTSLEERREEFEKTCQVSQQDEEPEEEQAPPPLTRALVVPSAKVEYTDISAESAFLKFRGKNFHGPQMREIDPDEWLARLKSEVREIKEWVACQKARTDANGFSDVGQLAARLCRLVPEETPEKMWTEPHTQVDPLEQLRQLARAEVLHRSARGGGSDADRAKISPRRQNEAKIMPRGADKNRVTADGSAKVSRDGANDVTDTAPITSMTQCIDNALGDRLGRLARNVDKCERMLGQGDIRDDVENLKRKLDTLNDVTSEESLQAFQLRLKILDTDLQLLLEDACQPIPLSSPFDDQTPEEKIADLSAEMQKVKSVLDNVRSISNQLRDRDSTFQNLYEFSETLCEAEERNKFLTEQLTTTQEALGALQESITVNSTRLESAMSVLTARLNA